MSDTRKLKCGYCHEDATEWMEWRTTGRPKGAPVCPACKKIHDIADNFGHHPTFEPLKSHVAEPRATVLAQVFPNAGYSPSQVGTSMTLNDILDQVNEAIGIYGGDALVVTRNDQQRGAKYGKFARMIFAQYDETEE